MPFSLIFHDLGAQINKISKNLVLGGDTPAWPGQPGLDLAPPGAGIFKILLIFHGSGLKNRGKSMKT